MVWMTPVVSWTRYVRSTELCAVVFVNHTAACMAHEGKIIGERGEQTRCTGEGLAGMRVRIPVNMKGTLKWPVSQRCSPCAIAVMESTGLSPVLDSALDAISLSCFVALLNLIASLCTSSPINEAQLSAASRSDAIMPSTAHAAVFSVCSARGTMAWTLVH